MLSRIYRFIGSFFKKTRTIDNEPLNKVSLIVIILIDIFILVNVFSGLNDISQWYLSPSKTYPCYSQWHNYLYQNTFDKDYRIIRSTITAVRYNSRDFEEEYQKKSENHLGKVNNICLNYAKLKDNIRNSDNKIVIDSIDSQSKEIEQIEEANQKIRSEYDSTLLEQIAGQARENSINSIPAVQAKQELEINNKKIDQVKTNIVELKQQLLSQLETTKFITFLGNQDQFKIVEKNYDRASFWYSTIQLGFQCLFLLPLIFVASWVHHLAQQKRWGLISLITWHLLVIFFIPLIFKLFEFLHIGIILRTISDFLKAIFLDLLFLVHYVYILIVPLVGFGIIKFLQKIVFNTKIQASKRVQKSLCVKCAKKIRKVDSYCPHCGYYQYIECSNCHQLTYKDLPYCNQCGHPNDN